MYDVRSKLVTIGNTILTSSKNELYVAMRFLDIALNELSYESTYEIEDIATNGEKIFYNSRYLIDEYKKDRTIINRAYLHMILHCIFRHLFNKVDKDEIYWDLACDIAVESIIDGLNYKQLKQNTLNDREDIYNNLKKHMKVLTSEKIYMYLLGKKISKKEIQNLQNIFYVDDHSYWPGDNDQQENSREENHSSNSYDRQEKHMISSVSSELSNRWQSISEKMKTNLETFSKVAGTESGDLLQHINVENREKYDYKAFLKKFAVLKEDMEVDDDSFDYIFYTYGLSLYKNMPLIEPLEYKDVKKIEEFVIAIDTSGSCSGKLIKTFIEETYSILKSTESFFKKINIRIIQCDTQIQDDCKITSEDELEKYIKTFKAKGLGGTDFRPVFDYVNNLVNNKEFSNLKGLVYFTDGYGQFPTKRPSYDVAFIFLKEDYTDIGVPPWAIKLILEADDLKGKNYK